MKLHQIYDMFIYINTTNKMDILKIRTTLFSLFLMVLILSSGCHFNTQSKPSHAKQQLRLNLTEPPSLDVRKAYDTTSCTIIQMCFEGLLRLDANQHPSFALAERFEHSADYTTYTFFLRDAKWSDGHPITAYDFEKTWKTILLPSFPCPFAFELYILKNAEQAKMGLCSIDELGVKALNDHTLVVTLNYPAPYFLELVTTHSFFCVPQHIVNSHPHWAENSGELFVCSGPFLIKKWHHHNDIFIQKNPHYWDVENVILEEIFLSLIEDENTVLTLFENGNLDWAGSPFSALPIDALTHLKNKGEIITHPVSGIYYYVFNTRQFPFNNVHIRRAFSLCIHRQAIIDNITQSGQQPAMALIPPSLWKTERYYFQDHDLQEARKEFEIGLKELKITEAQFPPITLSFNSADVNHKIAQAIQEQWQRIFGIRIQLESKDWKIFLNELNCHQFQIARMGSIASFNDATSFLDFYKDISNNNNYSQWTNPQFTHLLELAQTTINQEKRCSLLMQAEQILINEMPIAPIYFYTGCYLKNPALKGAHPSNLFSIDFKYAYIEVP